MKWRTRFIALIALIGVATIVYAAIVVDWMAIIVGVSIGTSALALYETVRVWRYVKELEDSLIDDIDVESIIDSERRKPTVH
jgi:hypothetical protein